MSVEQGALAGWAERGVLAQIDLQVVRLLAGDQGEEVQLAMALAVRAPRVGDVALDLTGARWEHLQEGEEPADGPALALPADREAWRAALAACPLVQLGPQSGPPRPFVLEGALLYTHRYWRYEAQLAAALRALIARGRPPRDPALLRRGLGALFDPTPGLDLQRLAAALANYRDLTVLSGGPGTGKTYTVRALLTLLWAQERGLRVAVAAPTGKAAARVKESLLKGLDGFLLRAEAALPEGAEIAALRQFLEDLVPTTLHRLLGWRPDSPTRFRHDERHPLPYQVVVVDEGSMVDLPMFSRLVGALGGSARLVLLGDRAQLASVAAGSVFSDLCGPPRPGPVRLREPLRTVLCEEQGFSSEHLLPGAGPGAVVQLTVGRRFQGGSGIGRLARHVLGGDAASALAALRGEPDLALLDPQRSELQRLVLDGYRPYLRRLIAGPRGGETYQALWAEALRLFDGFRVLTAHRGGELGAEGLNTWIGGLVGRALGVPVSEGPWLGRPVLVERNDYGLGLLNGDIGLTVLTHDGPRVAFPGEGGVRLVSPQRLPEHSTVFAMTIHKSQGSEYPHVMVVLPERRSPVLTRELVYTGITRASQRLTMVGSAGVFTEAVRARTDRISGLGRALWGASTSTEQE
ncbi:MAG: exodeoxyribonuclease V subunit alpha [Deltaproteobacteria bacterium]|nr:exodeoxyribonuclease V subunit alpha [Deltaproteobacteria bacterium]